MNILAIGAHPDDIELLCAGTLAKHAAFGDTVFMAVATNGNVGSETLDKHEIAAVRLEEARQSCELIGATLIWMDFEDEWLFDDRETRARFIEAYREAQPDVVIAHASDDYHPDHRAAGQIAADAQIPSAVRLVQTGLPALRSIPKLYQMETLGRVSDRTPTYYVDITDHMDTKRQMLACHASQGAWLHHLFDMSYVDFMVEQGARRGEEHGVRYAEAFYETRVFPPSPGHIRLGVEPVR